MNFIKKNISIITITLIGFFNRLFAIFCDPFLHPWDERFHALVSKNLINNPIIPILRVNPVTNNYDPTIWCCNHIWLHKQPLFMWQMAFSMRLFGVSEWSMRLPSALMGTILIIIIYRIALLLTNNKYIALISSLLLTFSNFHLQMISGIHGMDHNDVAHGFYILSSIWAYCEYLKSKKWYWCILVGLFSGCAILVKWLTGLFVYLIWTLNIVLKRHEIKYELFNIFYSISVCFLIFLPWQFYILNKFPELARFEYEFNHRHITEALEGHGGSYFYYLDSFKFLIGKYIYFLIPFGIYYSFKKNIIIKYYNISILGSLLFVLFFYSVVVKTKVDTYLFFIVPIMLIYISISLYWINEILIKKTIFKNIIILTLIFYTLNPFWILNYLSSNNIERNNRIYNAKVYKNFYRKVPNNIKVIMNMNSFEDIDVMFYNNGVTAYHWTLPEIDFDNFKKKKIKIAVFKNHGNYNLPEYVLNYPYLFIINESLIDF